MRLYRLVVVAALSVICNTNQSYAQTPPGFSPSTNKSLEATFGGTNPGVGGSVLLSSKKCNGSYKITIRLMSELQKPQRLP